jgi:REP element-mobilizing transposase RayT
LGPANRVERFWESAGHSKAFQFVGIGSGMMANCGSGSFFDHIVRNQQDFEETLEYIRMNPVRRGLVKNPEDWPYTERLDYLG